MARRLLGSNRRRFPSEATGAPVITIQDNGVHVCGVAIAA
jgi:hypothetical protein